MSMVYFVRLHYTEKKRERNCNIYCKIFSRFIKNAFVLVSKTSLASPETYFLLCFLKIHFPFFKKMRLAVFSSSLILTMPIFAFHYGVFTLHHHLHYTAYLTQVCCFGGYFMKLWCAPKDTFTWTEYVRKTQQKEFLLTPPFPCMGCVDWLKTIFRAELFCHHISVKIHYSCWSVKDENVN